MNGFLLDVKNQPGELAKITEGLAAKKVNLLVYSIGLNGKGVVLLFASDDQTCRSTLKSAGITFKEFPVLFIKAQDRPGQAASVARKLADEGINIQIFVPVQIGREATIALGVDNPDIAEKVLSDQITTFTYA